jgi:hypothetical protein
MMLLVRGGAAVGAPGREGGQQGVKSAYVPSALSEAGVAA